jgi:hypothetical protein
MRFYFKEKEQPKTEKKDDEGSVKMEVKEEDEDDKEVRI